MKYNISESKINAYDLIAPYYDALARLVFGRSIEHSQHYQVSFIPQDASILILGGGTGWLLEIILREKPLSTISFLDASRKMISIAQRRRGTEGVRFIHGRMADLPTDTVYDVIIANFFFDQFTTGDLEKILPRLSAGLKPGGSLFVADFVADSSWKKALLAIMYQFFSALGAVVVSAIPPWQALIDKSEFKQVESARFCGGFIHSTVYRKS